MLQAKMGSLVRRLLTRIGVMTDHNMMNTVEKVCRVPTEDVRWNYPIMRVENGRGPLPHPSVRPLLAVDSRSGSVKDDMISVMVQICSWEIHSRYGMPIPEANVTTALMANTVCIQEQTQLGFSG